ncbi:DNA/RNA helicase domain-containing protein [uncultured Dubosiella sp.]|uniref:DNA/RNA helicase domain-containing protein n=1 Tax=uncultured Dubosiella sp. TaxID=1937011 RepID=UPI00272F36E4|nr:DNA/RNA helicase domain-containing protein [uncultured Dubosiella sp.]
MIQLFIADEKYTLQNRNSGQDLKHDYFQRQDYHELFQQIWNEIHKKDLAIHSFQDIKNSDLFKFSPFHTLTTDQYETELDILETLKFDMEINQNQSVHYFVTGDPGTGKTVLAIHLIRKIIELTMESNRPIKIGFVIPVSSLKKTIERVFKKIMGMDHVKIVTPTQVSKEKWDLLIVDEAHRLKRRVALSQYGEFDRANERLKFDKEGTELDWILKQSKYQIFFYDPNQTVKSSDIPKERFDQLMKETGVHKFKLSSQMRSLGGEDYIQYIKEIFSDKPPEKEIDFSENYQFGIYNDLSGLIHRIKNLNDIWGLSRIGAGYAWKWKTKPLKLSYDELVKRGIYDIEIDDNKLIWNMKNADWIGSENSINEVGCIHTMQGYDLNFAGIIIGNEITYNWQTSEIEIRKKNYYDRNGKVSLSSEELKKRILNIYTVLLTRGIRGTFLYVCDPNLKEYLRRYIPVID